MTKRFIPEPTLKILDAAKAIRISPITTKRTGHLCADFRLPDGQKFNWVWQANHRNPNGVGDRAILNNRSQLRRFLHTKLNVSLYKQ